MAFMGQDKKKQIVAELRKALQGSRLKYSVSVHNYSTIVLKIKSGPIDLIGNYVETVSQKPQYSGRTFDSDIKYLRVNDFCYKEQFTGAALDLMNIIIPIMHRGNHNRSDIQSDYHDAGWYVNVSIGQFGKPYVVGA